MQCLFWWCKNHHVFSVHHTSVFSCTSAYLCFRAAAESPSSPFLGFPWSGFFLAFFRRASSRWFPPVWQTMRQTYLKKNERNKWHLNEQPIGKVSCTLKKTHYPKTKQVSKFKKEKNMFQVSTRHACHYTNIWWYKEKLVQKKKKNSRRGRTGREQLRAITTTEMISVPLPTDQPL